MRIITFNAPVTEEVFNKYYFLSPFIFCDTVVKNSNTKLKSKLSLPFTWNEKDFNPQLYLELLDNPTLRILKSG